MRRRMLRDVAISFVVFVALIALSAVITESRLTMLNVFMAFTVLALSLDLMIGDVYMLGLGHAAFFGAGAYSSALMHQEWGWSLWAAGPAAVLLVALLALLIGLPAATRTTGLYFSIITFAFGEILVQIVYNTTDITGGTEGMRVNWGLGAEFPFDWSIYRYFSLWIAFALLVTMVVVDVVRNSHFGLRLNAIRESEDLTRGLGFNPNVYKTAVFVIASCLAGLVGVFYAPMVGFMTPDLMGVNEAIFILGLIVVGGLRSKLGAFLGVFLLSTLPLYLELGPVTRPIVVGVGMMAVVLFLPRAGLAGLLVQSARRAARGIGVLGPAAGPGAPGPDGGLAPGEPAEPAGVAATEVSTR